VINPGVIAIAYYLRLLIMASATVTSHILAIEDDPVLAAHLQQHLLSRGFRVTLQDDGCAGLEGLAQPFVFSCRVSMA